MGGLDGGLVGGLDGGLVGGLEGSGAFIQDDWSAVGLYPVAQV